VCTVCRLTHRPDGLSSAEIRACGATVEKPRSADAARPALLILTGRGAAVSDRGISYRFDPQPEDVSSRPRGTGGI
jgi:hypothetical protein